MDEKKTGNPIIQAFMNESLKEVVDKYAPLHELKFLSQIEDIDIGIAQEAVRHK